MKEKSAARDWIRKAGNDLLNARNTLATMGENCPYDTVCFHAQQVVEKCVKALLAHRSIKIKKVHYIHELIGQLPEKDRPPLTVEEQVKLSNYAVAVRYPGVHDELDRHDSDAAVRLAEKVMGWIDGKIGE